MRFRFGYEGSEGAPFEIASRHEPRLLQAAPGKLRDEDALLSGAFEAPVGAPPLREAARGARLVVLLVDDSTRATRASAILPHVSRELEAAGVGDERVEVLTAQGTHRAMSEAELDAKIGPGFRARWKVRQHDWKETNAHARLGVTSGGLPVVVDRRAAEADLLVGVGHVGVHGIMGFSGGAKIVLPGIAGAASETWTHWQATWHAPEELMGVMEGPIRREIEEGARLVGLDAVLNVAMDRDGNVRHAAYGDFVRAQRACAGRAAALHAARLDEPVDVVVTDSRPADRDLWQSAKGLYAATLAVKEGGVIVLVSPNAEGVAENHPSLRDLAGLPLDEIRERVERGAVENVIAAAVAALIARIRARSDVHIVSGGIRPDDARRMGMTPFAEIQHAVDAALEKRGPAARVAVLEGAGGLLPVVGGRNAHLVREAA